MTNDGDRLYGISNVREALVHYQYPENTHHLSYIEMYFITFLCLLTSLSILSRHIIILIYYTRRICVCVCDLRFCHKPKPVEQS